MGTLMETSQNIVNARQITWQNKKNRQSKRTRNSRNRRNICDTKRAYTTRVEKVLLYEIEVGEHNWQQYHKEFKDESILKRLPSRVTISFFECNFFKLQQRDGGGEKEALYDPSSPNHHSHPLWRWDTWVDTIEVVHYSSFIYLLCIHCERNKQTQNKNCLFRNGIPLARTQLYSDVFYTVLSILDVYSFPLYLIGDGDVFVYVCTSEWILINHFLSSIAYSMAFALASSSFTRFLYFQSDANERKYWQN